ncbi:EpsG family protein [Proteus mirabilis]|uniref:EpsG family protein n=1 Tax=Proteus mirabilis TaxID=584 RepID=UPI00331470CD
MSLLNYIFRFLLLTPCIYFLYFPFKYNLDYINYFHDYENSLFSYDFLYEWLSYLIKVLFDLNFNDYWLLLMFFQIALMAIVYNRFVLLLLAYPIIISLSQFLYGTQVRYSISILFLLISIRLINRNFKAFPTILIPILFHYGMAILALLFIFSRKLNYHYLIINKAKGFLLLISSIMLINLVVLNIESIIQFTRFKYYIGSDSYLGNKSWSSILFIFVFLALLLYGIKVNVSYRIPIVKLSIIILVFCLSTSSIAILSGRALLVFLVISPILIYELFRISKLNLYTALLLILYIIMNISFYIKNDYYFY